MKKSIVLITVFILTACTSTPQVTPTPEATVTLTPPPTETPIPIPTFHPQFTALQNEIVASSTRFILQADGLIYDGETPIPGITVAPDGRMSLTVNGETLTLDPDSISFGEDGVEVEGYELDDNGEWDKAVSEAMQQTTALLEKYGIAPETVTVTQEPGVVSVTDNVTGIEVIRTVEGRPSKFDLGFAVDVIAPQSCEVTPYIPRRDGRMTGESARELSDDEYMGKLRDELNIILHDGDHVYMTLLRREERCWGFMTNNDLFYRDANHVARRLPLIRMTDAELHEFVINRYDE